MKPATFEDPAEAARSFVRHLEDVVGAATERLENERAVGIVRWAASELQAYSQPLFMALEAIEDILVRELAADALWHVLAATHFIGAGRGAADAGRVSVLDEVATEARALQLQAQRARQGLAAKTQEKHARLRAAILHAQLATKAEKLVASRAFADSISEEVWSFLGGSKEGASLTTIERVIASILKDGDAAEPHP